jgi:hypothetical protein
MKFWRAPEMVERFNFVISVTDLTRPSCGKDTDEALCI